MRLRNCALCHIDLDGVSVRRGGQTLLQDISTHIHCGQLTVLIGQNGAGKTTLIRALLGEIPYSGAIRHKDSAGRDLAHLTTGYVPQHLSFDPEMPLTVRDFLAASMTRRPVWTGVSRKIRARVDQALADVEAGELADRPLGRCSGGELQRVLLALALNPAPDLLVLDEPVSGVDRNGLKLFLDTVSHLKETRHIAILLVSHDLRLVREYADYVVLLEKTVLSQGSPAEVFSSEAFSSVFGTGDGEEPADRADPGKAPAEEKSSAPGPEASPSRIVRMTARSRRSGDGKTDGTAGGNPETPGTGTGTAGGKEGGS